MGSQGWGDDGKRGQAPGTWGGGCREQRYLWGAASKQCPHPQCPGQLCRCPVPSGRDGPARGLARMLGKFRSLLFVFELLRSLNILGWKGNLEGTSLRLSGCVCGTEPGPAHFHRRELTTSTACLFPAGTSRVPSVKLYRPPLTRVLVLVLSPGTTGGDSSPVPKQPRGERAKLASPTRSGEGRLCADAPAGWAPSPRARSWMAATRACGSVCVKRIL